MAKVKDIVYKLNYILDKKQKTLTALYFFLSLIGAAFECLGISIIIPVMNIIISIDAIDNNIIFKIFHFAQSYSYEGKVYFIIFLVVLVYIIKCIFSIALSWYRNKFSSMIQRDISTYIMKSYLSRGYEFFLTSNYGEMARGVNGDTIGLHHTIAALLRLITNISIIMLVLGLLLFTDVEMTIAIFIVSVLFIFVVFKLLKRKMRTYGSLVRKYDSKTAQSLITSLQGFKDVLVLRKQKNFLEEYKENLYKSTSYSYKSSVYKELPTNLVEPIFVVVIMSIICFRMTNNSNIDGLVSTLSIMALGAFRILPYLGRISSDINDIINNLPSIESIYNNLIESEKYKSMHPEFNVDLINDVIIDDSSRFNGVLSLNNISFSYSDAHECILEDINLKIKKGDSIALIGQSGAGKSTLADITLGLLIPQKGDVLIDGHSIRNNANYWSKIVGYVPQTVFLSNDSILKNIAFGEHYNNIDFKKIEKVIKKANLENFINSLPDGINTFVGDRGVRLSGGQRQRIAIARALYHDPDILILDEATSALDNDTEKVIMNAIDSLKGEKTLIIIAHRLSTIENCDKVYEINNKQIIKKR